MKRKIQLLLLGIVSSGVLVSSVFAITDTSSIAKTLNWVPTPGDCTLCQGHYEQPKIVVQYPNPQDPNKLPTTVTASGPSDLLQNGVSVLRKNVVVTQPGRIVDADTAYIYRDGKTKQVTKIHLVGHVRMAEYGKLIVADTADYYIQTHSWKFHQSIYHLSEPDFANMDHKIFNYQAFGTAKKAEKDKLGVLYFQDASYSTCAPINPAWQISAKKVRLDQNSGRGEAYGVVLHVKKIPLIYLPYFNFPIDNRRKTGFLSPTIGYSNRNGFHVQAPFYWNMAPNYDMTITPEYFSNRGLQISDLFRYLSHLASGQVLFSLVPYDMAWEKYVISTLKNYQNTTGVQPYLDALNRVKNQTFRGFFSTKNEFHFSPEWSAHGIFNYATDDYYLRDFGAPVNGIYPNQLQNEIGANYSGLHWSINSMAQWYQTLHLIDQQPIAYNQYQRLPEIDAEGLYPRIFHWFDLNIDAQYVNFAYISNFFPFTYQMPIGERFHARTTLSMPINFASGYFTPAIAWDTTWYDASLQTKLPQQLRPPLQASRNLPIFDVDSGITLQRLFHFFHEDFFQTLEPRLFYLYVPYQDQTGLPFFDTQLLPLTYDQLFSVNRLSGYDRIENANQISFGTVSRILRAQDGYEILNAGLGIEYYFQQPNVPIINGFNPTSPQVLPFVGNFSPLVGEITYYPWPGISLTSNAAWNFSTNSLNNVTSQLTINENDTLFSVGYIFDNTSLGVPLSQTLGVKQISHNIKVGVSFPINPKISLLGYGYYDITNDNILSVFGGIQYSNCCWSVRLVASSTLDGNITVVNNTRQVANHYHMVYYLQFLLKGLGDVGNSDPSTLLAGGLPGYHDPFKLN